MVSQSFRIVLLNGISCLLQKLQSPCQIIIFFACDTGGELFHHLDLAGAFDEATAMFYAANVLLALEHLHSRGLVYRDLKPENLLLDAQGYCKVADFFFVKKTGADKTYTICGTPDYQVNLVTAGASHSCAWQCCCYGILILSSFVAIV